MLEEVMSPPAVSRLLPVASIRSFPWRSLKIVMALSIACAGAYGTLSEQAYIVSGDAVVTAYVLDIRSPIEGSLSGLSQTAGAMVREGDPLVHIENPLLSHEHLDNLRTAAESAGFAARADASEVTTLEAQQQELLSRSRAYSKAITSRLQLAVSEAESLTRSREAAANEARIELDRGRELQHAGILATASFDKLVAGEAIARHDALSQHAALESIKTEAKAAQAGLLTEPGANSDVTYSRQRADEISLRLADVRRSLAVAEAQQQEAHSAVLEEASRLAQLSEITLKAPLTGQVWAVQAMNGERTSLGEPVLSLVDCAAQFLLVEVPQDRLPDVVVGGRATFRLTGESVERTGIVVAASGDSQKESNRKFAAFPTQNPTQRLATVRLRLESTPGSSSCIVGRTARVLLPTQSSNPIGRFFRKHF